jgi:hypothetical protein
MSKHYNRIVELRLRLLEESDEKQTFVVLHVENRAKKASAYSTLSTF